MKDKKALVILGVVVLFAAGWYAFQGSSSSSTPAPAPVRSNSPVVDADDIDSAPAGSAPGDVEPQDSGRITAAGQPADDSTVEDTDQPSDAKKATRKPPRKRPKPGADSTAQPEDDGEPQPETVKPKKGIPLGG